MNFAQPSALTDRASAPCVSSCRRAAAALALAAVVMSSSAYAADYSDPPPALPDFVLRGSDTPVIGSPSYPRWEGFYFGAQAGQNFGTTDFGNGNSSQISYILANTELQSTLSNWTTLPQGTTSSKSFGGFIGYNVQWGDVVTGFEFNYNRLNIDARASDSVGPILVPGATQTNGDTVEYSMTVASSAAVKITDVLTARARAGWVYERYLPYAFLGLAVGRAEVTRSANVTGTKSTTTPAVYDVFGALVTPAVTTTGTLILPRNPQSESKSQIAYGVSAGLGVEVGLTQNMFLRAEWEYVAFAEVSDIHVQINTVRAGLGLKF